MDKKFLIIIMILMILSCQSLAYADILNTSAYSYVLMDEVSGRVLLEKNAHVGLPMASTTKIMTALLAIENSQLDEIVKVDERSINIEGSSIYLANDEEISMKDLLYGLMLKSGNDAATAIANHIAGDEEEFVKMMNERARSINALNTNFKNPHGLSHKDHYSTAYDLALITREAFKHEIFREIVSSKSYRANREKNDYFVNKNKTLWEYEGGDGVKTGYTMTAGRCLVSTAYRNGMRLIAVSLRAPDWFNDNYKLLDYGFENYKPYTVYNKNQLIKKLYLREDELEVNIVAENDLFYPLREDERDLIKVKINIDDNIQLPIDKGEVLGSIETYLDGVLIRKDNLISLNEVKEKNIFQRLMDFFR